MLSIQPSQKANKSARYFGWVNAIGSVKIIICLIATSFLQACLSTTSCACGNESKTYVGAMNRAQQAYYIESGKLTNSIEQLRLGIAQNTQNYNYSISVKGKSVFHYGSSQNNKYKSYIGGVFLIPATNVDPSANKKDLTTLAILCEANTSENKQISEPRYQNGKAVCGANTHQLD